MVRFCKPLTAQQLALHRISNLKYRQSHPLTAEQKSKKRQNEAARRQKLHDNHPSTFAETDKMVFFN